MNEVELSVTESCVVVVWHKNVEKPSLASLSVVTFPKDLQKSSGMSCLRINK